MTPCQAELGKREVLEQFVALDNIGAQARETVLSDLCALPLALLELLRDDGVRVVALAPGQDLTDSGWFEPLDSPAYEALLQRGQELFQETLEAQPEVASQDDPFKEAMARYWQANHLVEEAEKAFDAEELEFRAVLSREPLPVAHLIDERHLEGGGRGKGF